MGEPIRIAIAGVGNCAAALVQGIEYYRHNPHDTLGLMHGELVGYLPSDIQVVAAFDVDKRKVGQPLDVAITAKPNCIQPIWEDVPPSDVIVQMGPIMDGIASHMNDYPENRAFRPAGAAPADVEKVLRDTQPDVLLNYLPVGSEEAARYYARCCLNTGVSLINCIPVFIVSNPDWAKKFLKNGIPVIGDDVKSQVGATILHRVLAHLFEERGTRLERTYQLNTGGNTDFLNMLERSRLKTKKESKTQSVQSQLSVPLDDENIHIGPSDYVPWQNDNKVCFIRMEARGFGGIPFELEARLSVQDSPNSAGVTIDAIRYCKVARDRGDAGPLLPISAYCMKHPPVQMVDHEAREQIEAYISKTTVKADRREEKKRPVVIK
ncbi:MAG: inositol-3-phosphate synthase [Deltaproteobacteria bacterium]|nr:inositol-3-phosphate synthase [Deltaproteobacteria bacterium]